MGRADWQSIWSMLREDLLPRALALAEAAGRETVAGAAALLSQAPPEALAAASAGAAIGFAGVAAVLLTRRPVAPEVIGTGGPDALPAAEAAAPSEAGGGAPAGGWPDPYPGAARTEREEARILVLPVIDLAPSREHGELARGFGEDLAMLIGLHPRHRAAVLTYDQPALDALQAGPVPDAILDTALRIEDGHVEVEAQLICVVSGELLWQDAYSYPVRRMADLEDELAQAVPSVIGTSLAFAYAEELPDTPAMACARALRRRADELSAGNGTDAHAAAAAERLRTHAAQLDRAP